MEEAGAVSGVLAALTPTGVSQERLSRLLHGLGTSSRLSSFLFWLKAPVQRPIRRGGGGDRRSLRLADGSGAVESGQKPAATAGRLQ